MGVDHSSASRYLFLLVNEGVSELVEVGAQAQRKASRYRYLGQL